MINLDEKQKISQLIDVYGGLLTDRQRDFLDLHYNEDLSYGEIAESENISRQAVHDTIQHGKTAILHFEEHLGLLTRQENKEAPAPGFNNKSEINKELNEILHLLKDDIIYNVNPLRKKIRRVKELVEESR